MGNFAQILLFMGGGPPGKKTHTQKCVLTSKANFVCVLWEGCVGNASVCTD